MSAEPESDPSKVNQMFKNCWSCRVLSGGGMIAAGAYVYFQARKLMQRAGPTMGTAIQVTFALSVAAWGVVIIADPVGKMKKT